MRDIGVVVRHFAAAVPVAVTGAAAMSNSYAIDVETATHVGGDLTDLGKKLAVLEEATAKVVAAAPHAFQALQAALHRLATAQGPEALAQNAWRGVLSLGFIALLMYAMRRFSLARRGRWVADSIAARGAAKYIALEAIELLVLGLACYMLIEFVFRSGDHQDLLIVALLWGFVRWRFYGWLLDIFLRPAVPAFRLIAMDDRSARVAQALATSGILIGVMGISVMPVLLRAGLPVPAGQVLVLLQGVAVAAGTALALWRYARSPQASGRARRILVAVGTAAMSAVWVAWTFSVLLLEFSVFHSLVWSIRIAAVAFLIDSVLGLSANLGWVRFAQRSIAAAAALAIGILLAQVWLVQELAIVPPESWVPVRRSLITAAVTLFAGYVAWRYLHHWTEERLRAASGALGPGTEDDGAAPASRLTTILPMLRVLAGIAILTVSALLALSQLGIEITPLLAGAGVFGLALSFGSQALIRDIVSGIFFMVDDAFRVGEYIDTGRLKGTVEMISLRSVRLRHQNGQVHTIPYGQLSSITNFSRDWQTVKFNLRLARDTDIEKVRKTVKQLGQQMMEEPELGREFLQPLKLQGVAEIADSALVVRLKFTARPLKPSWVQRESLKRLYKVFGDKGIEFASNAVRVEAVGPGSAMEHAAGAAVMQQSAFRPASDQATPPG